MIPIFMTWFGRIHIGRQLERNSWGNSITTRGIKWLNKTPRIQVTDNTRLTVVDMLKGNYTKKALQYWQEAALVLGLSAYIKVNNDAEAIRQIKNFLFSKFDSDGGWRHKPEHIDVSILAYALMKLDFTEDDSYKNALDTAWELIQEHIGEDGTVQYRKSMKNYRYVDTIGFICPFLIAYGTRYHKDECIQLAVKQIYAYEKHGMLNDRFIPCHAYQVDTKLPIGLYGWGRGLGWYAIGLIDSWLELPEHNINKNILKQSVVRYSKVLSTLQQKSGNWNWAATRPESRADSSTTATLGWFMLNASRISGISDHCQESAEKAVDYLMSVTRRNGEVDFSQGDTKDLGVYSMLFNILPFTQGFCIRFAHAEINKGEIQNESNEELKKDVFKEGSKKMAKVSWGL